MKKPDKKTLDLFFTNRSFIIPNFQRRFVWKKREYEELYNYFLEKYNSNKILIKENKEEIKIFLGTIFIKKEESYNNFLLIDGQQRTTFFYFLLNTLVEYTEKNILSELKKIFLLFLKKKWKNI